jgi:trans-aconitate methyltransferase
MEPNAGREVRRPGREGEPMPEQTATPVSWNAAEYHAHSSAQTEWGRQVHAKLALRGAERIIDLGCGDGRLSAELAALVPEGRVRGLDADPSMIAFAQRSFVRPNLSFTQGDVRTFALSGRTDLIVSTAALHWVSEHEEVLRRCREHLAPGGRILFQMGGRGCVEGVLEVARELVRESEWSGFFDRFVSPWSFYGPEQYERWLPRNGFRTVRAELIPKDMTYPDLEGMAGWMRTTWMPILVRVPEDRREELVAALVKRYLARHPVDAEGRTHVLMVRLEVEAVAS